MARFGAAQTIGSGASVRCCEVRKIGHGPGVSFGVQTVGPGASGKLGRGPHGVCGEVRKVGRGLGGECLVVFGVFQDAEHSFLSVPSIWSVQFRVCTQHKVLCVSGEACRAFARRAACRVLSSAHFAVVWSVAPCGSSRGVQPPAGAPALFRPGMFAREVEFPFRAHRGFAQVSQVLSHSPVFLHDNPSAVLRV